MIGYFFRPGTELRNRVGPTFGPFPDFVRQTSMGDETRPGEAPP